MPRSALDCVRHLPLLNGQDLFAATRFNAQSKSARGLAQSKTWQSLAALVSPPANLFFRLTQP